eukprot:scaffold2164_cov106-Cylindrotheca_fusiformis.AAC.3
MEKMNIEYGLVGMPMAEQGKQGGKCCGSCCDYRRAVIIICTISLFLNLSNFIQPPDLSSIDASISYEDVKGIVDNYSTYLFAVSVLSVANNIVGLIGAITFNFWMVALCAGCSILNLILSVVGNWLVLEDTVDLVKSHVDENVQVDWDTVDTFMNIYIGVVIAITVISSLVCTYPVFFLAGEIKKGIMTKETYPREEFSCCCTSHRHKY